MKWTSNDLIVHSPCPPGQWSLQTFQRQPVAQWVKQQAIAPTSHMGRQEPQTPILIQLPVLHLEK